MFTLLAFIALVFGIGALLIGAFQFFAAACSKNLLWGFGCVVFPLVSLAFLILHWKVAKKPFLLQAAGFGALVFGKVLTGS